MVFPVAETVEYVYHLVAYVVIPLVAELERQLVMSPSTEFLVCLILHFIHFSELRPTVIFSDMWKSCEEFRLLNQQSFESVNPAVISSVVISVSYLFVNAL